jgi:diadenosine tetraphosphate (Ap4A) HIT family hydrolase
MFEPPRKLILFESRNWRVNQRVDAFVPGYLMMTPVDPRAMSLTTMDDDALREMGPLMAKITRIIEEHLRPRHLYVSRYGHMEGHSFHFHIIPVYDWMAEAFRNDFPLPGTAAILYSGGRE